MSPLYYRFPDFSADRLNKFIWKKCYWLQQSDWWPATRRLMPLLCGSGSFFPISIIFLLFPYCFTNFLIPPPCFLMQSPRPHGDWTPVRPHKVSYKVSYCMNLLTINMQPVLFSSLYFSSVASVHLYQGISTLLPLSYLWPYYYGIFFTSFPPLAYIRALLVQISYAIFFLYKTACSQTQYQK